MLNMVFMQGITPIEPMEKMSFENVGAAADASQGKQFGSRRCRNLSRHKITPVQIR